MTWILITNDDGIDAQALVPMARAMGEVAPVRVVVPDTERSWVGKAITRYAEVGVEAVMKEGIEMHSCTGFPADCVQLGVTQLFDGPPSLVVSGINLGYNHGLAYIQSSGTVGAALEAHLLGVDAMAMSAGSDGDFATWRAWALGDESRPMWERLAAVAANLAAGMLEAGPTGAVVSVNLPDTADVGTARRFTTVAETGYDGLFREKAPGRYAHEYRGTLAHRASLEGTDIAAAADGLVSITPVRGIGTAIAPAALLARLGVEGA
jgi:5'-nucleotidase